MSPGDYINENSRYKRRLAKSSIIALPLAILLWLLFPTILPKLKHITLKPYTLVDVQNPNYKSGEQQNIVQLKPLAEPPDDLYKKLTDAQKNLLSLPNVERTIDPSYPLGYNPDISLGQNTQAINPNRVISDSAQQKRIIQEIAPKLEELILDRKDPTELYVHTFKKGNSNEITYRDFFKAYINAFLRLNDNYFKIFEYLNRNKEIEHVIFLYFIIEKDGKILMDTLDSPYQPDRNSYIRISRYYDEVLKSIPAKFIPPSKANLPSPYKGVILGIRNMAVPFADRNRIESFFYNKDGEAILYSKYFIAGIRQ